MAGNPAAAAVRSAAAARWAGAVRWALALGVWFVTAIAHRKVSDAVGEPLNTPWGAVTPIHHTTEAAAAAAFVCVWVLLRRARQGGARFGTWSLWGLLVAAMAICHQTLVTIDIEVIHYPQYALVAVLLARALDPDRQGRLLIEVVLVSIALSVADECLQYFHLMRNARYFDFNDLVLNQLGTLAGLLWRYGFPSANRPAARGPRPLRAALLIATGACAAACGALVLAGALVVAPATPIAQDGTVRLTPSLRIVLQWSPGIYDNVRPSRSGGTYYVLGPLPWLGMLLASALAVWAMEARLRTAGPPARMSIMRRCMVNLRLGASCRALSSLLRKLRAGRKLDSSVDVHSRKLGRRVDKRETIAILGGTGDLGTGLAIRWAKAGHRIVIGSRTLAKAENAVAELERIRPRSEPDQYAAMENPDAARAGEIVVLTVPAAHQLATLESVRGGLAGKILIDVTVPLKPPRVGTVQLPPEGSAGKRAQELLGRKVQVVTAFQNVAAHLLKENVKVECDVLVCGDKRAARQRVIELAEAAGMSAWHAGPIENSAAAEALTSVLIQINRRHDISHSGIKIVGQAR